MLELAILGLLKERSMHGYQLSKRLTDSLGGFWRVSYGSLYPALRRLEKAGAIEIVAPSAHAAAPVPTGSVVDFWKNSGTISTSPPTLMVSITRMIISPMFFSMASCENFMT